MRKENPVRKDGIFSLLRRKGKKREPRGSLFAVMIVIN